MIQVLLHLFSFSNFLAITPIEFDDRGLVTWLIGKTTVARVEALHALATQDEEYILALHSDCKLRIWSVSSRGLIHTTEVPRQSFSCTP